MSFRAQLVDTIVSVCGCPGSTLCWKLQKTRRLADRLDSAHIRHLRFHAEMQRLGREEEIPKKNEKRLKMVEVYGSDWQIQGDIVTSIAARGGGGSFKRLKIYNSEEHVPIESFVTTLIH